MTASGGQVDVALLVWAAVGVFGAAFGLGTVMASRRAGALAPVAAGPASAAPEASAAEPLAASAPAAVDVPVPGVLPAVSEILEPLSGSVEAFGNARVPASA